jgi:hypothetical protein
MNGELKEIQGPYDILDMKDGETQTMQIRRYEKGTMKIVTAEKPEGKTIPVLRVWCVKETKQIGAPYWDITSQTLIAQMMPYLEAGEYENRKFAVTKYGVAPRARFTLTVSG